MKVLALMVASLVFVSSEAGAQTESYDGRPTFAEDTQLAYYVWRDGDTWHLRWTTLGGMRTFTGSVDAEGGKLRSLKRIDVEQESRIYRRGRPRTVVVGPRGRTRVVGRAPVVVTREQDHIDKDGDGRIVFTTRTDDIDGFDFKVDDKVSSLTFVLNVDGRPVPNRIEVGKDNYRPGALPLVVRLLN